MSLVEFVIDKLDDLKGTEIVHFDVKGKSSITENMIICTGTSSRQVSAMADNLIAECKKRVMKPLVKKVVIRLIDRGRSGQTIVHIMQRDAREMYQLENFGHKVRSILTVF